MTKYVFDFTEGNKDQKELLGGKGANLAEMTRLGLPVPPGFIITTRACNAYLAAGEAFPPQLWEQMLAALHQLENQTGKRFGDPRVDFALARACRSCPMLASEAYSGELLDRQLDSAARRFLADPKKNRFDPDRRELMVSPLFQWNVADFQPLGGEVGVFRRYGPEESVAELKSLNRAPTISYTAYDWSLNAK